MAPLSSNHRARLLLLLPHFSLLLPLHHQGLVATQQALLPMELSTSQNTRR